MNSQKLNEFQKELTSMFQRKVAIIQEVTRLGVNDTFSLKLKVRGHPIEERVYGKTVNQAEGLVRGEMFTQINKAHNCDLFSTRDKKRYHPLEFARSYIRAIYGTDEILLNEPLDNYEEQRIGVTIKVPNGKYEYAIENDWCTFMLEQLVPPKNMLEDMQSGQQEESKSLNYTK